MMDEVQGVQVQTGRVGTITSSQPISGTSLRKEKLKKRNRNILKPYLTKLLAMDGLIFYLVIAFHRAGNRTISSILKGFKTTVDE